MTHHAAASFWKLYDVLPEQMQQRADKQFALLKSNPSHPSLHFKPVGTYWSARISDTHRALANRASSDVWVWFWIGSHREYERLIRNA